MARYELIIKNVTEDESSNDSNLAGQGTKEDEETSKESPSIAKVTGLIAMGLNFILMAVLI